METQFTILLVAFVFGGAAIYGLIRWIQTAPVQPDPWESLISESSDEAQPTLVCPRCLTPNSADRDFCETCGLPVGACTNLSPYLYLFSVGDLLRTGASGRFPIRPFTIIGYVLLPICSFAILAPFYWYRLFRNIDRLRAEQGNAPSVG